MRDLYTALFLLFLSNASIAQGHLVTPSEFEVLLGDPWKGNLTYLDYASGQETSIKAELQIQKITEGEYRFLYIYPDEPKANSKQKVKIGKNHMTLNKRRIVSRSKTREGLLEFETKHQGKDNRKAATVYTRYTISNHSFSITKEVQYEGDEERTLRNSYSFQR